jgi:pimeloyl-ACP methyl ester carboxylesterase
MRLRPRRLNVGMVKRLLVFAVVGALFAIQIGLAVKLRPVAPLVGSFVYDLVAPSGGAPAPVPTAQLGGSDPGSLVRAITMPNVTRKWNGSGLSAARVVYRSTSGDDNRPTVVSGSVFVPTGKAPDGGWPVVSLGHGTVGIENPCAPSLSDNLSGNLNYVAVLTRLGYAVALADFQGLGTKGVHPYTDSRTAGLNMIDAVRALRRTFPDVSDRWVGVGDSQGGGASWAADEQAKRYAPELKLLGALAASPGPDLVGLVDKAQQGTLTQQQRAVFLAAVESLARLHPDLNRDDFRRGAAAHYWNVLLDCTPTGIPRSASALKQLGGGEFEPSSPQAAARLRDLLTQWALPQLPLSAPLYVWYGGKDPFIDAAWTKSAIQRACALGGVVTIVYEPDGGHNPPDAVQLIKWMADRFDGKPAKNDC